MDAMKCPNCGFENPLSMKFCGNCGKPLIKQEKKGERKIISILYADIAGFTTISETMDPEKIQDMLNTIFENISYSINKFGGTVHKYIGDEVMALFGAPIAYENHAERAAHAALEINKSVKDIVEKINLSIDLHIALHSGEVVLGTVGSEEVQDYTVIGDTVNVASRLEKIAPTGKILASSEFYDRTKHIFKFEPFGEVEVKGKSKSITCYLLKDVSKQRGKVRGIHGVETPLLGREKEIAFLRNLLKETKENNSMRLVVIDGQPGIGKSRLFQEFGNILNKDDSLIFETRSLPFGQEEMHPFKQLVRNITSVSAEMTEIEAKDCMEASLIKFFGTRDLGVIDLLDVILDFISIKEINLEPKRKQQIMYYMIENLLRKLSERRPVVIGFEDFHWADSSSLLLLKHLIEFLQDQPILFILITRPLLKDDPISDFLTFIKHQKFSSILALKQLDKEVSYRLVTTLLSIDKLPSVTKERIVNRGEGNPLFIEELIKFLMDKKLIYKDREGWKAKEGIEFNDIPQSINEIVMARVDLLQSIEKRMLQYASVIGRIFWDKPLKAQFKQGMIKELSSLSNKGFVKERLNSLFEDAKEYIFNHILIQEAIYSGILKRVRKEMHRNFANWLEENYPQMENIISNLLAFHFEKGEIWEKAVAYYILSGKESAKNYNNKESLEHFYKALDILNNNKVGSKHFLDLYRELGKVLTRLGKNDDAEKYLTLAMEFALSDYDKFSLKSALSNLYQKMSLYDKAIENLELAKQYLKEKRSKEKIDLIFSEMWLKYLTGNIRDAFNLLDDFDRIYKLLKDRLSIQEKDTLLAKSFSRRATLLNYSGDTYQAKRFYSKAQEIYEKYDDFSGLSSVYNNFAAIYHTIGECSKAIEMYEKSQELDRKMGNKLGTAIGYNNLAEMYIFLNDFERAEEFLNKYLELNKKIHNRLGFGFAYLNFGVISQKRKDYQRALDYYKNALTIFEEVKSTSMVINTYDALAWLYFKMKKYDYAKEYMEKISEYLKGEENLELKASMDRLMGYLQIEDEDYKKAEISLNKAYKIYEKMSSTEHLIPICCDFIELYTKQGNMEGIVKFKKKGEEKVKIILHGIKNNELKDSFLRRGDVRKILD